MGAGVVIWLAEHITEPHRRALDWLNQITGEKISFFGIEIELWRIGDSDPAPKFNVVSKPNAWQKMTARETSGVNSDSLSYLHFWEGFCNYCEREGTSLDLTAPRPSRFQTSSIGRSGFGINFSISKQKRRMAAELFIDHPAMPQAFAKLDSDLRLKNELGSGTEFQESGKRARIVRYFLGDVSDPKNWPEMYAWLKRNGEELKAALQSPVKSLVLDQESPEDETEDASADQI